MREIVYIGIGPETGICVKESEAFDYALERLVPGEEEAKEFREVLRELLGEEVKEAIVDWYFSGNWIKEETDVKELC